MSIEAMKLALEALLDSVPSGWSEKTVERRSKAIDALRAAIEQAEKQEPVAYPENFIDALRYDTALRETVEKQEPVAWPDAPKMIYLQVCDETDCEQPFDSHIEVSWCQDKINDSDIAYYRADTAPPQREWQGLTDEEIKEQSELLEGEWISYKGFARAIEAKLKEKNA